MLFLTWKCQSLAWGGTLLVLWVLVVVVMGEGDERKIDKNDDDEISTSSHRPTVIAFGSCHKNFRATVPSIWDKIIQEQPEAFVWMGDAMYPSSRDPITRRKRYGPAPPAEIQQAFEDMKSNHTIGYSQLLQANVSIYGTWDDHDYGGNDMGKHMSNKEERQDVFWNFLGYRPHTHEGMYHSIDIPTNNNKNRGNDGNDKLNGHVKLILLDTRWFRDNHCIPTVAHLLPMGNAVACATRWATAGLNLWKYAKWWGKHGCDAAELLGEEQWKWLRHELLSSRADLNIIVSSIQIWTTNPAMESWGQFPKEQERLWNLIKEHYVKPSVGPVIFWSGDVHHAEIIGQPGYLEVTSSGMTHHCGQPKLYGRLCRPILESFKDHRWKEDSFFVGLNYGVLKVDWNTRVATVEIKNDQGITVLQVDQSLDISHLELPQYEQLPHTWDGHLIPWLVRILSAVIALLLLTRLILSPFR